MGALLDRFDAWTEIQLAKPRRGWNSVPPRKRAWLALLGIVESAALMAGFGLLVRSWVFPLVGWLAQALFFGGLVVSPSRTFRASFRVLLLVAILGALEFIGFLIALAII